jgi:hypothetical protein
MISIRPTSITLLLRGSSLTRYQLSFAFVLLTSISVCGQHVLVDTTVAEIESKHTAKTKKVDFSIGIISGISRAIQGVESNDRFYAVNRGYTMTSLGTKANLGINLNQKNAIGLTVDFSMIEKGSTSFNTGLRYVYRQPINQGNIVLYNPIEVLYSSHQLNLEYATTDTIIPFSMAYVFTEERIQSRIESLTFSFGFGATISIANSHSVNFEFALMQSFGFNYDYLSYGRQWPEEKINQTGVRLGVLYGF